MIIMMSMMITSEAIIITNPCAYCFPGTVLSVSVHECIHPCRNPGLYKTAQGTGPAQKEHVGGAARPLLGEIQGLRARGGHDKPPEAREGIGSSSVWAHHQPLRQEEEVAWSHCEGTTRSIVLLVGV